VGGNLVLADGTRTTGQRCLSLGGLAGFGVLMVSVALMVWRVERFCARQYWQGLREYKL
jgi:hypothetical protein